ncbi:hypothetical protein CAEBREN_10393 [Caenorhabditis brenneri]|uniref:Uncharacterized protein n=1 Tax=Caenorhabditis brenneri TaxID=135651 RepID=G0NAZ8_CAEBE|nr:hypothetical protein CAEBREN_10393 [Caenorhabditis brenneri]
MRKNDRSLQMPQQNLRGGYDFEYENGKVRNCKRDAYQVVKGCLYYRHSREISCTVHTKNQISISYTALDETFNELAYEFKAVSDPHRLVINQKSSVSKNTSLGHQQRYLRRMGYAVKIKRVESFKQTLVVGSVEVMKKLERRHKT